MRTQEENTSVVEPEENPEDLPNWRDVPADDGPYRMYVYEKTGGFMPLEKFGFDGRYSYSALCDQEAIAVLEGIRDGKFCSVIAAETGLSPSHVELLQTMFCNAGWANYGSSPRGCFPENAEAFDAVIAGWKDYYEATWGEPWKPLERRLSITLQPTSEVVFPGDVMGRRIDHVAFVLGLAAQPWTLQPIGHLLRDAGEVDMPRKAEAELAAALHWMLGLVARHGDGWSKEYSTEAVRLQTRANLRKPA